MTILIFVVAGTLLLSALCSLLEATLYSTRSTTLEATRAQGRHVQGAEAFIALKRKIAEPTAAILILNTVANTAGATVAGMLAARHLGVSAVPLFSVFLTLAILLFSEILPKTYGALHWRGLWPVLVWPLVALRKALKPAIWLTEKFSSLFSRGRTLPVTTEGEILAMIQLGAKDGELTPTELELLTAVFRFDETTVKEIMIPRHEVMALAVGWSVERCAQMVRDHKHTRYPLCSGSLDSALGVIHVKDLIGLDPNQAIDLVPMARPLDRIPDLLPIRKVLRTMQESRSHLALVVDEHGTVVGAVTLENVIEQIVGSVQDEFDSEEPVLAATSPGVWIAHGQLLISKLNEELELRLEDPSIATLSGLLTSRLGRLPRVGDRIRLETLEAEVLAVAQNRASRVRLTTLARAVPETLGTP
ncbi:MAG: hemolysin family protein [Thermoanaerobaculia bacterium]|nr:hemolysin family protein [Thermoanaerobaculia bacterium]